MIFANAGTEQKHCIVNHLASKNKPRDKKKYETMRTRKEQKHYLNTSWDAIFKPENGECCNTGWSTMLDFNYGGHVTSCNSTCCVSFLTARPREGAVRFCDFRKSEVRHCFLRELSNHFGFQPDSPHKPVSLVWFYFQDATKGSQVFYHE